MFTADVRVQVPPRPPKRKGHPKGCPFSFSCERDLNNVNAICRWHIAATSANTGGYNYFCPRGKNATKSRLAHHKRQAEDCLFFCQSILPRTGKTPVFPTKTEAQGYFLSFWGVLSPFVTVYICFGRPRRPTAAQNQIIILPNHT